MFVQPEENPTTVTQYTPFKIDSNVPPPRKESDGVLMGCYRRG